MDMMLRVNHYRNRLAVRAKPPGRAVPHTARMPVQKDSSDVRLFPLPSLFKKEVDPIDFSPCIKQETIINV